MEMDPQEKTFVVSAFKFLERPSFLIRLANSLGKPVEAMLGTLPVKQQGLIHRASEAALRKGLLVVTRTVPTAQRALTSFSQNEKTSRSKGRWHSLASFGTGAVGGFFGMVSLPLELPATTAIMLRSIVAIAQEFGMDIEDPQVQLECLYILSLGAADKSAGQAMNSSYWTSRSAFAQMSREAVHLLGQKGVKELEKHSAPVLVRFLAKLASRFEVVVSEKLMAEAVPVIGALGGGLINAAFTDYFSEAARYHFGLRALENRYGREKIEAFYTEQRKKT